VAAVVALAAGGLLVVTGGATRAGADPVSSCSTTSGVVIVVDFSAFGGAINQQCDPDTSTDALTAMNAEGFATQGDSHDGDGFVCRINNLPTPAQDPCVNTPPATAYWAFWIANPGQTSWSVSPLGAMSLDPKPGSTELWSFGSGATPSFPPSAVAATDPVVPTTAPTPVTTAPVRPGGTGSAGGGGTTGTNGTGTKAAGTNETGAGTVGKAGATPHSTTPLKSTDTTGTPAAGGTPSKGTRPATTRTPTSRLHIVDAAPASSKTHPTSGSPVALFVGALAVVALAAAALIVVRRRRLE
jgi:hypothetical protein